MVYKLRLLKKPLRAILNTLIRSRVRFQQAKLDAEEPCKTDPKSKIVGLHYSFGAVPLGKKGNVMDLLRLHPSCSAAPFASGWCAAVTWRSTLVYAGFFQPTAESWLFQFVGVGSDPVKPGIAGAECPRIQWECRVTRWQVLLLGDGRGVTVTVALVMLVMVASVGHQ